MQSKKQCSNILIILKENSCQPRIYTQKKISFTNTTKWSLKTPSLSSLSLLFPLLSCFSRLCQFACENNYLDISFLHLLSNVQCRRTLRITPQNIGWILSFYLLFCQHKPITDILLKAKGEYALKAYTAPI